MAGRWRPGIEVALARPTEHGNAALVAGAGLIVGLGRVDVRVGVHAGLTDAAADVAASLWVTGAFPVLGNQ